ncbi:NEDD8 ultimate buster 1-like [Drosophila innubila]|uniref:NEDD8 ultimate buster 1-like n=1 Tax=Drosophila innubila TaxID=198719 RepID=UPI00148DA2F7|nr:NEDD8 ultimate buster 1-like [Drosophila innubila]
MNSAPRCKRRLPPAPTERCQPRQVHLRRTHCLPNATLASQQLKNNQQLIVIIGQGDNHNGALHDRINKIKEDVEAVVASQNQLMEMEDQDGNPVFLPPNENRALLTGMGYCEKARSAMHREDYEEALLLLEADEQFNTCNSKFLESVDNYALINLDIVWCYLCLKCLSVAGCRSSPQHL